MSKYLVVRPPSTPEDEGRYFLAGDTDTLPRARKIAKKLHDRSKGYYTFEIYKKIG